MFVCVCVVIAAEQFTVIQLAVLWVRHSTDTSVTVLQGNLRKITYLMVLWIGHRQRAARGGLYGNQRLVLKARNIANIVIRDESALAEVAVALLVLCCVCVCVCVCVCACVCACVCKCACALA